MESGASQAGLSPPPSPSPSRRSFFRWLVWATATIAAALVGGPAVTYILRTRARPVEWIALGRVAAFPLDETRRVTFDNPIRQPWDGIVAHTAVYVRYEGKDGQRQDRFLVLGVNCAHLGCPVSWFPESALFMCPCHGGVYYSDGSRASGPPPRGLFQCAWRVRKDRLEIQAPHYPTLHDTLENPA
jgi:menaquinol-cytochrome c reductase iron-sulfur subunit